MKKCRKCKVEKPKEEFGKNSKRLDGLMWVCKTCWSAQKALDYKDKWFTYQARLKKSEAKRKGLEYNLTPEFLRDLWTDECPVYKVPFVRFDKSHPNSPALDRIDPSKGYVQGNVQYISARANRIKYDATVSELRLILSFLEGATTIPQGSTLKRVEAPDTEDKTQ